MSKPFFIPNDPVMDAVQPGDYLRWRESSLGAITEEIERDLVFELAGELEGRRVLDVGCGDGTYAVDLAERGAHVAGVDASCRMLQAARDRAASKGLALDLRTGDVRQLPFADESFDVVLAVTVLCFVTDANRALSEMARVLAPGGRLVIGELGRWSTWAAWRRLRGWLGARTWELLRRAHAASEALQRRTPLARRQGAVREGVAAAMVLSGLVIGHLEDVTATRTRRTRRRIAR